MPAGVGVICATNVSGSGTSRVYTLTAATATGDTILVLTSVNTSAANAGITALTDSKGNIYTQDKSFATSPAVIAWRAPGATGGPAGAPTVALTTSDTFTVTCAAFNMILVLYAFKATSVGPMDGVNIASNTATSVTATVTPTADNEACYTLETNASACGAPTIGAPFTQTTTISPSQFMSGGYVLDTGAGTAGTPVNATFTVGVSGGVRINLWSFYALLAITTASPLPGGTTGSAYSQTLAATGGGPTKTWTVTGGSLAGSGLSLSSAGVLSGTAATAGTYNFTAQVADAVGSAVVTKAFSVTITSNLTVTTSSPMAGGTVGVAYSQSVAATGGSGASVNFLTGQNTGFEGGNGNWTGAGNANIANSSAQAHGGSASMAMSAIAGSGTMTAASFAAANIVAQGRPCTPGEAVPVNAWFRAAATPENCQVGAAFYDAAGAAVSGSVVLGATTPDTTTGWTQLSASVVAPASSAECRAVARSVVVAIGEVHYVDDVFLAAPLYTWAVSAGALPGGLSMSSVGLISGTPSAAGTFTFTAQVTDTSGNVATKSLQITIANTAISITTGSTLPGGSVGTAYSQALAATGGTGTGYTWTLIGGALPTGVTLSSAGLISGTPSSGGSFSPNIRVTDSGSNTASQVFSLTITVPAVQMFPLPVLVELLLNGTWTDVTEFVYIRDGIQIQAGRVDENSTPSPATCTMTFNNADGRFSPNYASGFYSPYLQRNIQLRVSLRNAQSSSGNIYSGYRFWGKVPDWPVQADVTVTDVYVQITASGSARQTNQGGGSGSALTRYYATLTGSYAPVAYWPCEDGIASSQIQAGLAGGTPMSITQGTPTWKATGFNGSGPVPIVNKSTWDGLTGSFGATGDDVYNAPGNYSWMATTTTVDCRAYGSGGGGCSGQIDGRRVSSGSGGELAREATLAVTPGKTYNFTVPAGGQGGSAGFTTAPDPGLDGADMVFVGDAVTVTGHGGKGGPATATAPAGGTGSANTVHQPGGAGAATASGTTSGGAGGGSSGGLSAAGNAGSPNSGSNGGAGGAAPAGGGPGGQGGQNFGDANPTIGQGYAGGMPGAGGGSGGASRNNGYRKPGGAGASGYLELIYAAGAAPATNVCRFMLFVPKHGGNNGGVLTRWFTGGTVSHFDVMYGSGGSLRLVCYNNIGGIIADTGYMTWGIDNQYVMVSVELAAAGANVSYGFRCIRPGDTSLFGQTSGSITTATLGSVSEVTVGPNADITKSSVSHLSVQYALIDLRSVSRALNGHDSEMGMDRFARLCREQGLAYAHEFKEGDDHWGFEGSTQSWVATNCTLSTSTLSVPNPVGIFSPYSSWPTEGTSSLLVTASGAGPPFATSPVGTAGRNCVVGDTISVAVDCYVPTNRTNMYVGILWYQASGAACTHAEDDGPDTNVPTGFVATLQVSAVAPAGAAFFAIKMGDHFAEGSGQTNYFDHVRVHPQMGPQSRKQYKQFIDEVEDLDQGMIKAIRNNYGLGYRTRIRLLNQTPAVTLDYSQNDISLPFTPVFDDQKIKNDITVHRHKGSRVRVSLTTGSMSTQEPPRGTGKFNKTIKVLAHDDGQLAALGSHLLNLGTVSNERYPTVTVDLTRAALPNAHIATLMSAVAAVDIGDYVQIINLPFYFPSATAKQLVLGYNETLAADGSGNWAWTIVWNCTPENPYEITVTSTRRW